MPQVARGARSLDILRWDEVDLSIEAPHWNSGGRHGGRRRHLDYEDEEGADGTPEAGADGHAGAPPTSGRSGRGGRPAPRRRLGNSGESDRFWSDPESDSGLPRRQAKLPATQNIAAVRCHDVESDIFRSRHPPGIAWSTSRNRFPTPPSAFPAGPWGLAGGAFRRADGIPPAPTDPGLEVILVNAKHNKAPLRPCRWEPTWTAAARSTRAAAVAAAGHAQGRDRRQREGGQTRISELGKSRASC